MRHELVVLEVAVQAVAAEQEHVTLGHVGDQRVDLDRLLDAHGAGDDVPDLADFGLRTGDEAALDLLLHEAVVLGELVHAPATQQVRPAVARVRHHRLPSADDKHDTRGAHAPLRGILSEISQIARQADWIARATTFCAASRDSGVDSFAKASSVAR